MNSLEAAEQILAQAGKPLPVKEITRHILERDLWKTKGATPERTIDARIAVDIKTRGTAPRFQRTGPGVFALRSWGHPEYIRGTVAKEKPPISAAQVGEPKTSSQINPTQTLTFTDAAEQVLERYSDNKPMHYEAITRKALDLGLIKTEGQTPGQTMYAQILTEIKRKAQRGEAPRFNKLGKGLVGLSRWIDASLAHQIEQHNKEVRNKLRKRLHAMAPSEFEDLIGALLVKIGFEDVQVTGRSGDGGIDVRGTLVVGSVIRTRMAIQAKRWKSNVQAPIVHQVRGSLGAHERGLIITTSDFSDGARKDAAQSDKLPVALMNGEELVALMVEHDLGVQRTSYDLFELGPTNGEPTAAES